MTTEIWYCQRIDLKQRKASWGPNTILSAVRNSNGPGESFYYPCHGQYPIQSNSLGMASPLQMNCQLK